MKFEISSAARLKATKILADSRSYVVDRVHTKFNEQGFGTEPEDRLIGGYEVKCIYSGDTPKSKVLIALRASGLREHGLGPRGTYLFTYNKTPKLLGWVEYNPKDGSVLFD